MSAAHFATPKETHDRVPKLHGQKNAPPEHKKISAYQPLFSEQRALVQRKGCACGGGCPMCKNKKEVVQPGLVIQPKLKVGATNDKYEQEADRVAEHVVNGGGTSSIASNAGQPAIQRMCSNCAEEEDENPVQRKSASEGNTAMPSATESYIQSLGTGGAPLSQSEANYFEPRFGQSFSHIRIHNDAAADRAAKSINARAFTVGNNIAFANGEHDSTSVSGRKLMAHELTHTVQQASGAHSVQRGSAGVFGGKCCNPAPRVEWALVGAGVWKKLQQGECTSTSEDCDGMTCGGGFYHVDNLQTGRCSTPRNDDSTFAPRRWTPSSQGASAHSPTAEGSTQGDTPPNWEYDSAATTACPNGVRTISVDFVRLHGATHAHAAGLAAANNIYSGCCVRFVAGATPPQESLATTQSWLGGDTDLDASGITCSATTTEEKSMYDQATAAHSLSSRMRVFFVSSFSGYSAAGFSRPPYCSGGNYVNHVILGNSTNDTDDLAHEFGHILLNSGNHSTNNQDLMFDTNVRGTNLSPSDCATIYGNA